MSLLKAPEQRRNFMTEADAMSIDRRAGRSGKSSKNSRNHIKANAGEGAGGKKRASSLRTPVGQGG